MRPADILWSRTLRWFVVAAVLIVVLPRPLGDDWYFVGINTATYVMVAIGLDLMWGLAGQVSLGQQGFVAIGAYGIALSTTKWDVPVIPALLVGIAAAAAIALVVGVVVLRLQETYLALATLGFGLMVPTIVLGIPYTGRATGLYGIPSLPWDLDSKGMYYLYWVIALLLVLLGLRILHSTAGLAWRVTAHNEAMAQSCGVRTTVEKLKAFVIGSAIAGFAGGLFAINASAVSPATFNLDFVLIVLVGVVVGGRGTIIGTVFGLISLTILLHYSSQLGAWTNLIFAAAFVFTLRVVPGGIVNTIERLGRWSRSPARHAARQAEPTTGGSEEVAAGAPDRSMFVIDSTPSGPPPTLGSPAGGVHVERDIGEPILVIEGVRKQFDALVALNDVSLTVHRGEIHGIVGPNGAGKSTLLAAISGLTSVDRGTVVWCGDDVTRLPAWRRSRLGIARSFQSAQVVPDLSVRENVMIGLYLDTNHGLAAGIVGRERGPMRHAAQAVDEVLEHLGIADHADEECQNLSFGQMRLTELGRCFVSRPKLLLLDEAAAGLDRAHKSMLIDEIRRLAAEGTTVCLIEHDTDLVSRVCDNVTVLDSGAVLKRGAGTEIFHDAEVRSSYMGQQPDLTSGKFAGTAGRETV